MSEFKSPMTFAKNTAKVIGLLQLLLQKGQDFALLPIGLSAKALHNQSYLL